MLYNSDSHSATKLGDEFIYHYWEIQFYNIHAVMYNKIDTLNLLVRIVKTKHL